MSTTDTNPPLRVLVIDDTPAIHDDFQKIFRQPAPSPALATARAGLFGDAHPRPPCPRIELDCVSQGQEGLACVRRALAAGKPYAVAFVDMRMPPGWDGIETIRYLWAADPDLQIVICTAYSDHTWEETVGQLGEGDSLLILKKPFDNIEVLQLAHALTRKWLLARRHREHVADLDERVRQRTADLLESEERFARIFHASPVPIALQALADGRYLDANPAFLRLVECTRAELLQHTPADLGLWPAADVWGEIVRSLDGSPLRAHQAELRPRGGARRHVLVSVEPADLGAKRCVVTSLEDVTDRLLLEEKFRQAQKMEAIGQLAAGVAHDFNNLLTVMQAYTGLVLDEANLTPEQRAGLSQVRAAADRAAALTRQLLVFSRRQLAKPAPLDLAATFAALREMLGRLLPADIAVEWHAEPGIPRIHADEANLEQVIMNLVVNARDAMPRGGTLRLGLRQVRFDDEAARRQPDRRPGDFVCISVSDTGVGIDGGHLGRIFEPFFTTKPVGKGTGLGLSTVYAIVRQHEGWIEVASTPGQGTTFEMFFAALDATTAPVPQQKPELDAMCPLNGRGKRILLVEDELSVRLVARTLAERAGYRVTEASDGPSALRAWSAAREPFDLLLTDMEMPNGTNGSELAAMLRARHPSLKVIFTTGYSKDLLQQSADALAGARILLKPFARAPLLATLREALECPA